MKMYSDGKKGVIPFAIGTAASSISYVIIGQLTYALTTSFAMAGTVVGLIMIFSRIFDGISDICAGYIIDKCHFKLGKARPFDLFNIPMWIFMVLCFEVPNLGTVGKVIYVFLMYNLCQSVCYTFVSVSSTVRVKRSFTEDVRAKALAASAILSALLSTALGIISPILISTFAARPHGWMIIAACFAIPGILMTLCMFFMVPEMENAEDEPEETAVQKTTILDSAKLLLQNPYTFLIIVVVMANTLANSIVSMVSNYYYQFNLGNLQLASLVGLMSLVGYIFLVVMPTMTKKLGNRKSIMTAYTFVIIGNLAKLVMPHNIFWLAACSALSVIGIVFAMSIRDLIIIDCMRYGHLKTGTNNEGIYASIRGFSDKIATGLVSLIVGVILDMGHFDGTLAVQPSSANTAITILFTVVPAVIGLIAFVAMYFCHLEDDIRKLEEGKKA